MDFFWKWFLSALFFLSGTVSAQKTLHILSPWNDGRAPLIMGINYSQAPWYEAGGPTTPEGNGVYSYTFSTTPGTFAIRDADGDQGVTWATGFSVPEFSSVDEVWVVADPVTGNPVVVLSPPRFLHLLNPWPITAPLISVNGSAAVNMEITAGKCGWFSTTIIASGPVNILLSDIADGQVFGLGGYDDNTPIDLTQEYATYGNELWFLPEQGVFSATDPGVSGECTYSMATTIRDFSSAHPDFEPTITGGVVETGMVQNTLGIDGKPVLGPSPFFQTAFNTWFNTDSSASQGALRNYETCRDVVMNKTGDGMWEYDSYIHETDKVYFPIDDFNRFGEVSTAEAVPFTGVNAAGEPQFDWGAKTSAGNHNFHFCMETHAEFIYQLGQLFSFRGDDDVWVFINNKLVIDLGGMHVAWPKDLDLDTLGLVAGQNYPFDFFFCERKTTGSNLRIKTSIYFKQQKGIFYLQAVQPDGSIVYTLRKVEGATGSCSGTSGGSMTIVDANDLSYVLTTAIGDTLQSLSKGNTYFGGITLSNSNLVTIDEKIITGLSPGNYRVWFRDNLNSTLVSYIAFQVAGSLGFTSTAAVSADAGTAVALIIAAYDIDGNIDPSAVDFSLVASAGLLVFADTAMTQPITGITVLSTSASTGQKTVYVTAPLNTGATATYSLEIRMAGGTGTAIDTHSDLTFVVPALRFSSKVAIDTLAGHLVPITVGGFRDDGSAISTTMDFSLWSDDLQLFADAAGTTLLTGADTLTTAPSTGTKTIWATLPRTALASGIFSLELRVPGGGGSALDTYSGLKFTLPSLRFALSDGSPMTTPVPVDTFTFTFVEMNVEAFTTVWGRCTDCSDSLAITAATEGLQFFATPGGEEITTVALSQGRATFYLFTSVELASASFTLTGPSPATSVTYSDMQFSDPPIPLVDSAWIFDKNLDGIADSLVVLYRNDLDSLPDAFWYFWPENDTLLAGKNALVAALQGNRRLIFEGNFTEEPRTWGVGWVGNIYGLFEQAVEIQDRIGPFVKRVRLQQNFSNGPDTIYVDFSEEIPPDFFQAFMFLVNDTEVEPMNGFVRDGNSWIYIIEKGLVGEGDRFRLNPIGGITDLKKNPPGYNPDVIVEIIRMSIPPADEGNLFLDLDADGTMDAIQLSFLSEVSLEDLSEVKLFFVWLNAAGLPDTLYPKAEDWVIDENNGRLVLWTLPENADVLPLHTGIEDESYGLGIMISTDSLPSGATQDTLTLQMADGMAPVIGSAFLNPGARRDTVRVVFTESIDTEAITRSFTSLYRFRMGADEAILEYQIIGWRSNNKEMLFYFRAGLDKGEKPFPGDFIQLLDGEGYVVDLAKNTAGEKTRWVMLVGQYPVFIDAVTFVTSDDSGVGDDDPGKVTPLFVDPNLSGSDLAASEGHLGHLVPGNLLQMVLVDLLGESGASSGGLPDSIGPEDIFLDYEVEYFTNLGSFVIHQTGTIGCDDVGFNGDCTLPENEKNIFLEWNHKSSDGRFVGSGAYLSRISLTVRVLNIRRSVSEMKMMGLLRGK